MKKKLVCLLMGMLLLSLGACSNKDTSSISLSETSQTAETTESVETSQIIETAAPDEMQENAISAPSDGSQMTPEPEIEKPQFVSDRSEAFALVSDMTEGWNLGNTFDAFGAGNTLSSETTWGNPKTTREMIDAIAQKGINTIRIPVTWAEHMDATLNGYVVNDKWMDRVAEVVDYAMNDGMYVILDTHHETEFWLETDVSREDKITARFVDLWEQIATRFAGYDDHLLFEGLNEPRLKGSAAEWNGGTKAERDMINHLNHAFVDTVRSVPGNEKRFLVICPYGNSPNMNALKELEIPDDNNILVAVHMYTPYYFTYEDSGSYSNWDSSRKAEIVNTVKQLDKYFLSNDVPVIITEFGAMNKNNEEDVLRWLDDYLSTMNKYGIKCVWWDNGIYDTNGEKFAIFNRNDLTWYSENIVNKLVEMSSRNE